MNPLQPRDDSNDPLDHLLQQWSRDAAPSSEQLDVLTRRTMATIAAAGEADGRDASSSQFASDIVSLKDRSTTNGSWRTASVRLLAVAASVALIAAYCVQAGFWLAPEPTRVADDGNEIPIHALLDQERLSEKATLLKEMELMFDRRFQWLVETNDQVEVGTSTGGPAAAEARPLVVRLVVERRESSAASWRPAYTVDIVTRSEQVIRVEQIGADLSLALWAYAMPDGMIAVDADLLAGDFSTTTNEILADGQPKKVDVAQSNGAEYRVFQAAFTLDSPLG